MESIQKSNFLTGGFFGKIGITEKFNYFKGGAIHHET